jgi:two-component system, NtrC family, response regulator GlrR
MLAAHGGNVTRATQASRKDRRAFFELMRKHHIEPARFRGALD